MTTKTTFTRWSLLWESRSKLNPSRHLILFDCLQLRLFKTRSEARAYASEKFGYIRKRRDLHGIEPHCWRMPRAVRVKVVIELCEMITK